MGLEPTTLSLGIRLEGVRQGKKPHGYAIPVRQGEVRLGCFGTRFGTRFRCPGCTIRVSTETAPATLRTPGGTAPGG